MIFNVRIGGLERDFGHAYSAELFFALEDIPLPLNISATAPNGTGDCGIGNN